MARLTGQQQQALEEFVCFAKSKEDAALKCLKSVSWDAQKAREKFYSNPAAFVAPTDEQSAESKKIRAFFLKYSTDRNDTADWERIGPNGMMRLINDLGLDPADRLVLALAWKLKAQTQCEFSWEEFHAALSEMNVASISELKKFLPSLTQTLAEEDGFRSFYRFTFEYVKSDARRGVDVDLALAYWDLVFDGAEPRLRVWEQFLRQSKVLVITRDTWNQFQDFLHYVKPDCSDYDVDSSWPVILDEFVDFMKKRTDN